MAGTLPKVCSCGAPITAYECEPIEKLRHVAPGVSIPMNPPVMAAGAIYVVCADGHKTQVGYGSKDADG